MIYVDVFDTETAGLSGGVCDIAIATIDEDFKVVQTIESLIDPERPIEPGASGVHHITDDMVVDAPTLAEFMQMHRQPFNRQGLVVCGHNVQFDIRMCQAHLPIGVKKICTLKLARTAFPDMQDHKLQTLRYALKLEAGDAHRAMGDVVTCISLLRRLNQTKGWSLQKMLELSAAPISLNTKFPFGKHKGTPIKDVPRSYCSWALANLDLEEDLRAALTSVASA